MMDSRMEWARSRDQLVSAIRDLGFPEELGEQIAKQLRSPKAMDRMKGYLYNVKPRSAELIVDEMLAICSDIDRWREKKAYHDKGFAKFFWGGKSAVMAEKPELEEVSVDLSGYDWIIFGFPVWASNFTPPLRTFIEEHSVELRDKKFSAFACQSGSGAEKALGKLAKCIGIDAFEQTAVFIDPKAKHDATKDEQIEAFCKTLG